MKQLQKAISVHAPYAWALMYAGKPVENRSPNFPQWHRGERVLGRVWVHASKADPRKKAAEMLRTLWSTWGPSAEGMSPAELFAMTGLEYGAATPTIEHLNSLCGNIVGSIEVYDYRSPDDPPDSPWYVSGSLAIMVGDPQPLAAPVPAKGALGWWVPPGDVLAQCEQPQKGPSDE